MIITNTLKSKSNRLDLYGIQIDDPIRLETWKAADFIAFGDIHAAGCSATGRNKNAALEGMRCYSTNQTATEMLKGSQQERRAIRNKMNVVDLFPFISEMRLSDYWRDEEGYAPPSILTAQGELLFRQWLGITNAEVKAPGEAKRRPVVQQDANRDCKFVGHEKAIAKRVLEELSLTPNTKRQHFEELGLSPP